MKLYETIMKYVFLLIACVSIVAVLIICVFLFANGIPAIAEIGPVKFLLGKVWRPGNDLYGIFPYILGSIYITAGAIVIGVPIGIFTAVYMARFCNKTVYRFLKPATDLMAGIPSVIYGFFGMVVIVPFVRDTFGGRGSSIFTASILLGIMILPTIISVSEASIRAVNESYYEGSVALGATKERSIFAVMLPAAKSGVASAVILGIGRAIGETMAVVMVAGNQPSMPKGLLEGARSLTANVVIEMGYATGLHREALIATGVVLFIFILIINLMFSLVLSKGKEGKA